MNDQTEFEKEKRRKLSPSEARRLQRFEAVAAELEARGFRRKELTIGIVKANVLALLMAIPVCAVGVGAFLFANPERGLAFSRGIDTLLFLIALALLVFAHEGIHGLTWSRIAEHGFRDIEFGFMREYLTPYCTCLTALPKGGYVLGGLMPLVLLGVLPTILAICLGSPLLLMIGLVMIVAAGGDILIVFELLRYRSDAREQLIYDHPTQAGCVIFEK